MKDVLDAVEMAGKVMVETEPPPPVTGIGGSTMLDSRAKVEVDAPAGTTTLEKLMMVTVTVGRGISVMVDPPMTKEVS